MNALMQCASDELLLSLAENAAESNQAWGVTFWWLCAIALCVGVASFVKGYTDDEEFYLGAIVCGLLCVVFCTSAISSTDKAKIIQSDPLLYGQQELIKKLTK